MATSHYRTLSILVVKAMNIINDVLKLICQVCLYICKVSTALTLPETDILLLDSTTGLWELR